MIKFFRKIRQRLLSENKFSKYFIYAIGEIILVVIGILLALQLNNLKEQKNILKQERNALELIQDNLKKEINDLDRFVSQRISDTTYLKDVYYKNWEGIPLDSLGLKGTSAFNYKSFNTAYEGLKSNDKLFIIQNENLKEKIIFYYEQQRYQLLDWSDWHRTFVYRDLENYMFTELPINPNELIDDLDFLKTKLEERRLKSLISNQIGSLRRINHTINEGKVYANEIIDLIDKEIDTRWRTSDE